MTGYSPWDIQVDLDIERRGLIYGVLTLRQSTRDRIMGSGGRTEYSTISWSALALPLPFDEREA